MANDLGYRRLRVLGYEDDPIYSRDTVDERQDRSRPKNPFTGRPVGVSDALMAPNQPSGSVVTGKDQSQLIPNQFGYGTNGPAGGAAVAAIEDVAPGGAVSFRMFSGLPKISGSNVPGNVRGGNVVMRPAAQMQGGPLQLAFEPMSQQSGESFARNARRPVITPSGKIYGGTAPQSVMVRGNGAAPAPGSSIPTSVREALQAQAQASLTPAGGFQPVQHAGQGTDVHGNDLAFMPESVQTSVRQRTGY